MRLGLKTKTLIVLAGVLALTTALNALLAAYLSNRQDQEAAFAALQRDLAAWEDDFHRAIRQLEIRAASAISDGVFLSQLAELVALENDLENPGAEKDFTEAVRTVAYLKSVSINRLALVLRTSDVTSIAVYTTAGALSHYLSRSDAGMMVRRPKDQRIWVSARADKDGNLPVQSWPSWKESEPDRALPVSMAETNRMNVCFTFPDAKTTTIAIAVPVLGILHDIVTDSEALSRGRLISDLSVADHNAPGGKGTAGAGPRPIAQIVFRTVIDQNDLEQVFKRTGKFPAVFSPSLDHEQSLTNSDIFPKDLLLRDVKYGTGETRHAPQHVVHGANGSYYVSARALALENAPRLILALASSRGPIIQNIRETVGVIVGAALLVLIVGLGVGVFMISRLINPILALTSAANDVTAKIRLGAAGGHSARSPVADLAPITLTARDEVGVLGAAFNEMIAELRRSLLTLEQRVRERTRELEIVNRELESFSYSVSHDLRAPLRSIDGFSRALLEDYADKLDDEGKEDLQTVRAASQRMDSLIDDLLRLARINRGQMNWAEVDLSQVVQQIATDLRGSEPARNAEFLIAPGCIVRGDAALLRIALQNILQNAWKYSAKKPGTIIEFGRTETDEGGVHFVRDNGCGFDMRYVHKLFAPFQRLHKVEQFAGTGIGLAIVQRVIQRHGGRVWIEGKIDQGTTLFFTIPQPKNSYEQKHPAGGRQS